jgi:hypothetical protein
MGLLSLVLKKMILFFSFNGSLDFKFTSCLQVSEAHAQWKEEYLDDNVVVLMILLSNYDRKNLKLVEHLKRYYLKEFLCNVIESPQLHLDEKAVVQKMLSILFWNEDDDLSSDIEDNSVPDFDWLLHTMYLMAGKTVKLDEIEVVKKRINLGLLPSAFIYKRIVPSNFIIDWRSTLEPLKRSMNEPSS